MYSKGNEVERNKENTNETKKIDQANIEREGENANNIFHKWITESDCTQNKTFF